MAILIKGMDMPTLRDNSSVKMELRKLNGIITIGIMTGGYSCSEQWEYYPVVEVKEPHGRLIDADFMKELGAKCIAKRCDDGVLLALGRIDDLPTVVEAEGE